MTYVLTTPNLDATGHRWVAALANFDMRIEYQRGADNKVADALSRVEGRLDEKTVKEIMERAKHSGCPRAETDAPALVARHDEIENEVAVTLATLVTTKQVKHKLTGLDWKKLQGDDPILKHVIAWMDRDKKQERRTLEDYLRALVNPQDAKAYGDRQKSLIRQHGLLFVSETAQNSAEEVLLFVVPACKRQAALDICHRDTGHQGRDRTYSLLRERFWWPKMRTQMLMNLKNCAKCKIYEGKDQKPPLHSIMASEPMDLVHIDIVGMETTVATSQTPTVRKVLVIVDHFSRYVQAYKIDNKTAITVAKCLYDNYFRHFGFPRRLLSDQGKEFCNGILNEMCKYLGIKKLRTSPYHPQTNGAVERVHQTLQRMIGKLDARRLKNWPEHLSAITHAYNSTRSHVTGYSPYYLMFGRRPRLPIDLLFPTQRELPASKGVHDYVKALYTRLRGAIKLARLSADQEAARHKRLYDRRAGVVELQPGDKVLIRLDAFVGQRRKLKNRWSPELHTVVRRIAEDVPAYVVRNDRTNGEKVLHRARLLLWSSHEENDEGLQLTIAPLGIQTPKSGPEPASTDDLSRVPYEWSFTGFGLNLAAFEPTLDAPELETGQNVLAAPAGMLPNEGVGQREETGEETNSISGVVAVLSGDAPT